MRRTNYEFHGLSKTATYRCWESMIDRCHNPKNVQFKDYGGREILVCERWKTFQNFLGDMGEKPKGLTLDRKDNNGPYSPENCRWASWTEQLRNTSRNRIVEFQGAKMCVGEWAESLGINYDTLYRRIFIRKWPLELAFSPRLRKGVRGIGIAAILAAVLILSLPFVSFAASATLTWVDNSGNDPKINDQEEGFEIERKLNTGLYGKYANVGMNVTSYLDTNLPASTQDNTYCYRLRAYKTISGLMSFSGYSNEACITIPKISESIPAAPSNAVIK